MTIIHQIIIDRVGGTTVLSCQALNLYNLEIQGGVNESDIRKSIFRQLHITSEDTRGNFEMEIVDNRPEEKGYNEVRKAEDKLRKPKDPRL